MAEGKDIWTLFDFCEAAGVPLTGVEDLVEVLTSREVFELARENERLARVSKRRDCQALPLRDEAGTDFGVVEARIPRTTFWNLAQRPGFGWEGLTSDDGLKDVLRDFPQCRVETVSGRIVSGWTPGRKTIKKYG